MNKKSSSTNVLKSLDKLMSSMNMAMEKVNEVEKDVNLTEEQKKEMLVQQYKQMDQFKLMTEQLTSVLKKSMKRKEKNSKYHLSECVRKYKVFVLNRLGLDDSDKLTDVTEMMYSVLEEVFAMDNETKRERLLQLYGISLRDTLSSFKANVQEVIDNVDEDTIVENVEEFFSGFFKMVIESVTDKYNSEVEEAKKKEQEAIESEREKIAKEANPVAPKVTSAVIGG